MSNLKEIEQELVKKKDWQLMGEVDEFKRPANSLLSKKDIDFDVSEQFEPISSKQNLDIQRLTLQRLREGTFDNYSYSFKEEVVVEEEGCEDGDILELYNEIESELLKISDFGSLGFLPDVKIEIKEEKMKEPKKKLKAKDLEKIKNVTVLK
ncbi:U3 small nucleolar ribonucleoprotein MPP10 [Nosema granulosis]|uniref:U3 small nucleolar ribonucleoprotein MPP10 n=1 Tax=Nosema granulosis TaxID=83296 RepID=A0A9P6L045_9MICR|nr:U3 small nucleolar ribonucleoprotein MPP10 [Nosema granulosis]